MRSLGGNINPVTGLQQFETLKVLLHALFHLISISLYRGSYYHLHFQEASIAESPVSLDKEFGRRPKSAEKSLETFKAEARSDEAHASK